MFKLVSLGLYLIKMQTSDLNSTKCRLIFLYCFKYRFRIKRVFSCSSVLWSVRCDVINFFLLFCCFFVQIVAVLFFFAVASAAPRPTYLAYPSVYSSSIYSPLAYTSSYRSYSPLYSSSIYSPYSTYSAISPYSAYSPIGYSPLII